MARRKKNRRISTENPGGSASSSLGDLLRAEGLQGDPSRAPRPPTPDEPQPGTLGDLVVRTSRKGRGGRTVTEVTHLELGPERLEALARELRSQLGCGTFVEGGRVVVQGDQRERVARLLRDRARRVRVR